MIRGIILLSFMGLLLAACGDKDEDTGTDTAEAVDASSDDTAAQ